MLVTFVAYKQQLDDVVYCWGELDEPLLWAFDFSHR